MNDIHNSGDSSDHESSKEPGTKKVTRDYKEFAPTSWAIDHETSVGVLLFFIIILGVLSDRTIPRESFPEVEIPTIAVNTIYPGVSPADIESLLTRPLEEELSTISDIKDLTSTSVEGYSSIIAEFETSVNLDEALQKIREKVDLAKTELPAEAEDPSIFEFSFSEMPIMQVNLAGQYDLVRLKEVGQALQDRIEQIPSVLRVEVRGGLEREVKVDVQLDRLQFYDLSINDVIDAIRNENVNIPGGSIDVGSFTYLVRVDGEFDDPTAIDDLVIEAESGRPVYVRDVATVEFGFQDRTSFARLDDSPVVTLDIIKRSGYSIIETSDMVKVAVLEMEPILPPTTVVKVTSDQSTQVGDMVSNLENNIISGLILIVIVLLFFLGVGNSLFVAISIPLSMLLTFVVLNALEITLNMVVLFSLILALGMLVDNAIVVVENIYRYVEEGWDKREASKKATGEVAGPVIAATLTTLAAFAPLMFWPGQVGEFMGFMPITLIIALSSSLFVALLIIPTLCARFLRLENEPTQKLPRMARRVLMVMTVGIFFLIGLANPLSALVTLMLVIFVFAGYRFLVRDISRKFQGSWLPNIMESYTKKLETAIDSNKVVLLSSISGLFLTLLVFSWANSGVEFFPEDMPPEDIMVDVQLPVGSRAEATDEVAQQMEMTISEANGIVDASSVVATVGGSGSGGSNPMGGGASGPNTGRVTVSMVEFGSRQFDARDFLAEMQASLGTEVAGAEITVDQSASGPAQGLPINIEITGEDPAVLKDLSDQVLSTLQNNSVYGKLVGLESDLDQARPELSVYVDREKAALYGVSSREVGLAIRSAIQGVEAAKYRTGSDEYDIVVRLAKEYRDELESLRELTVMSEGNQIPLLSVADWEVGEGLGSIQRKNQVRMATISADTRTGLNSNAILAEVMEVLVDFSENNMPVGYQLQYTGQAEEQQEAMDFLVKAFLLGLGLIAMILVTQFNSVVKPVIILASVLLSTAGVFWGLIIFRMPFVIIMTGVGLISLAGIVVNNAIVMIDYIDVLRSRDGLDIKEALLRGGQVRFRPVILTAVTTALGLVPLAVGLNFDFLGLFTKLNPDLYWGGMQAAWWGPMAIAVIVGILFATFLTLVLVPALYYMLDNTVKMIGRQFVGSD
ncbi:MAG: efflux RND transporter permease subunit [Gemmatimonadota bacterium]|nr:efflux RND transporter permease subunit [Gemmatimonadota bacterium]